MDSNRAEIEKIDEGEVVEDFHGFTDEDSHAAEGRREKKRLAVLEEARKDEKGVSSTDSDEEEDFRNGDKGGRADEELEIWTGHCPGIRRCRWYLHRFYRRVRNFPVNFG